jgi:parallel beta-helix repeat protein
VSLKPPEAPTTALLEDNSVFDVTDHGVIGNGTDDDTAAIQAALSAASTADGGMVYIPDGTYKITSGLTYGGSDLTLEMAPGAVLNFSTAAASTVLLSVAGTEASSGTGFEALTANASEGATTLTVATATEFSAGDYVKVGSAAVFDAGRTDQPIGEIAVVTSGVGTTVTLRSPLAGGDYNTADTAFVALLTQNKNLTIRGGKIIGGGSSASHVGFRFDKCRTVRVEGTVFESVDEKTLDFRDCVDARVSGVSVTGANNASTGYGVFFGWACQDCEVSDSWLRDCRHAISSGGGTSRKGVPRRLTYANNHISDTTADAIDAHAAAEDINVLGNTIYDSAGTGINIECPKATVRANTLRRTTSHGVRIENLSSGATEYVVADNVIVSPGGVGIRYANNTLAGAGQTQRFVLIGGNGVYAPTGIGIHASSTDTYRLHSVTVENNAVRSGAAAGIHLQKADNCSVTGNVVSDHAAAQNAYRLSDVTKTPVTGNVAAHASAGAGDGFNCTSMVDSVVVGNSTQNADVGVLLDNNSTYNTVTGNNVKGAATPLSLGTGAGNVAANNQGVAAIASVASAATVALPGSENSVYNITGTADITSITALDAGRRVTLKFAGTAATSGLVDGSNLKLASTLAYTPDDAISLVCDGTNWYETGRSVN